MIDKISSNYFRILTLTIIFSFFYLVMDYSQSFLDDLNSVQKQIDEIELLKGNIQNLTSLRVQLNSGNIQKNQEKITVKEPNDFLGIISKKLFETHCKITGMETKELLQNKEQVSITLKIGFESSYKNWTEFRKSVESLPFRIHFRSSELSSERKGIVSVKETVTLTRFIE